MIPPILELRFIDRLFLGLLLVVFTGIVLHAPFMVSMGTVFPSIETVIKAWKEVLLAVAAMALFVICLRERELSLFLRPVLLLIAAYAALNLMLPWILFNGPEATIAGLMINLRFMLFFVLIYAAVILYPEHHRLFVWAFFAGATVVSGFAVLQVTVLPDDILSHLGYGASTILPYQYIDMNPDYVRVNSTLRGPNPLGAYAVIVIAMSLAYLLKIRDPGSGGRQIGVALLLGASTIALWFSYSRSALVAGLAAAGLVLAVHAGRRYARRLIILSAPLMLMAVGAVIVFRESHFVSNVILHVNPEGGSALTSNQEHYFSFITGIERMLQQPLGWGVGSTGSASLYTGELVIIENQYLFIIHELGLPGVTLFLALYALILWQLWRRRDHWLALGAGAGGVGLALIGLLLPVWSDDTVAIIWWGLAALALASVPVRSRLPGRGASKARTLADRRWNRTGGTYP